MSKSDKAKEIEGLLEGGMTPEQVIKDRPDLAEGFNDLVKHKRPRKGASRGSGATSSGPSFTDEAAPLEVPSF